MYASNHAIRLRLTTRNANGYHFVLGNLRSKYEYGIACENYRTEGIWSKPFVSLGASVEGDKIEQIGPVLSAQDLISWRALTPPTPPNHHTRYHAYSAQPPMLLQLLRSRAPYLHSSSSTSPRFTTHLQSSTPPCRYTCMASPDSRAPYLDFATATTRL